MLQVEVEVPQLVDGRSQTHQHVLLLLPAPLNVLETGQEPVQALVDVDVGIGRVGTGDADVSPGDVLLSGVAENEGVELVEVGGHD